MAIRTILCTALAVAVFAASAPAEVAPNIRACADSKASADDRIKHCSIVIESKQETSQDRALAYNNRGFAWSEKRDTLHSPIYLRSSGLSARRWRTTSQAAVASISLPSSVLPTRSM